jgi:hypothetical protein
MQRLNQKNEEKLNADAERQAKLSELVEKHKLSSVPGALDLLRDANNPEKAAELLSKTATRFDELVGGDTSPTDLLNQTMRNVYDNLGITKGKA